MDPFTAIPSFINSSIKIFEVTYQLKAVDEQTADLLSTTRHVNNNVNEARRLLRLKTKLLNKGERTWMEGVIEDAENALRSIAEIIEPARVDKSTREGINFSNKVLWVFRDNPKVKDKHVRLNFCHQSLMTVISGLYAKDVVVIAPAGGERKEDAPPPYDPGIEELLNWQNQRRRKSSMTLRKEGVRSPTIPGDAGSQSTTMLSPTSTRSSLLSNTSDRPSGYFSDTNLSRPASATVVESPPSLPEIDSFSSTGPFMTSYDTYEGADGLQALDLLSPPPKPWIIVPPRKPLHSGFTTTSPIPISPVSHPPTTRSYSESEKARYIESGDTIQSDRERAHTISDAGLYGARSVAGHNRFPSGMSSVYEMDRPPASTDGLGLQVDRPTSIGQSGTARRGRGRRNWLAYHATRSDLGHSMG